MSNKYSKIDSYNKKNKQK